MIRLGYLCAAAAIASAQSPSDPSGLSTLIAAIRQNALAYSRSLPNFICTQRTQRSIDYTGTGSKWQKRDTLELRLTYFGLREDYRLVSVNGKEPKQGPAGMGITSSGEFGSMLNQLFQPEAGADFTWLREGTVRGRRTQVFYVHVDGSHSIAKISVPGREIIVGYHGEIYADRDSKAVLRLVLTAEIPPEFPLQDISHTIDYGLVPVGGEEFLLPLHTEMHVRAPESLVRDGVRRLQARQVLMRNETDFVLYRKYTADTEIKFDSADRPKKEK